EFINIDDEEEKKMSPIMNLEELYDDDNNDDMTREKSGRGLVDQWRSSATFNVRRFLPPLPLISKFSALGLSMSDLMFIFLLLDPEQRTKSPGLPASQLASEHIALVTDLGFTLKLPIRLQRAHSPLKPIVFSVQSNAASTPPKIVFCAHFRPSNARSCYVATFW
ncbi:hypothetical protein ACHAXA_008984, partial [Cyclostephanos tholiformis]